jgi:hypothetical protein
VKMAPQRNRPRFRGARYGPDEGWSSGRSKHLGITRRCAPLSVRNTGANAPQAPTIDTPPQDPMGGAPDAATGEAPRSDCQYLQVPKWAVLTPELPHEAFQLYCLLLALVDASGSDGRVSLTKREMADLMGYLPNALTPHLAALLDFGVVDVEEAPDGRDDDSPAVYTVHREPPAGWQGPASLEEFYASLDGGAR